MSKQLDRTQTTAHYYRVQIFTAGSHTTLPCELEESTARRRERRVCTYVLILPETNYILRARRMHLRYFKRRNPRQPAPRRRHTGRAGTCTCWPSRGSSASRAARRRRRPSRRGRGGCRSDSRRPATRRGRRRGWWPCSPGAPVACPATTRARPSTRRARRRWTSCRAAPRC